jgi:hypothetical protein
MRGTLAIGAAVLLGAPLAGAADHLDSPGATKEPTADITDTYSWVAGKNVVLVMDVAPLAASDVFFSDKIQYVFHTASGSAFGDATKKTDVICTFDAARKISCWVGDKDYVTGDAGVTSGLVSDSGMIKVYAGLRDDPFFFNLTGFKDAVKTVDSVEGQLKFDGAGCPALDGATVNALVGKLQGDGMGGKATNFFAGADVLSIVLEIDKSLLTSGGPVMSMWGSTNKVGG